MAEPVPFRESNFTYTAPPGQPEVLDLPVFKGTTPDGAPCIISCIQFTKPELDELMRTGKVWVWVMSRQELPPMALCAYSPFEVKK